MQKISINNNSGDVYFVYDGDCPICQMGARGFKVRKAVGTLHLIDARFDKDNPVVKEINKKRLNLDDGMVIKFNEVYYHGADALHLMALLGTNSGWLNKMNYLLFRSPIFARWCYPFMRGFRNIALYIKNVDKINNLIDKNEPIFKPIFGKDWDKLPPVMHKHYANLPYSNHEVVAEGRLDFMCKFYIKPFLKLSRTAPAYNEKDVAVTVRFTSKPNNASFCFNRIFYFKDHKPYHFNTCMYQVKDREVIERMKYGICWHSNYSWDGEKVILTHKKYSLQFFSINIPLPITWLIGRTDAEEIALDDNSFAMSASIIHPIFGEVYSYKGQFEVKK